MRSPGSRAVLKSRREFLKTSAAAGATLVVAFYLPWFDRRASGAASFKPNAWLEIHSDGSVKIWTGRSEMGQGVRTAMPMIVAEELEVEWEKVTVVQADADPAYGDQVTVGSRSVRSGWGPLRQAGAAAREILIAAAALTWNVPREECQARLGSVEHLPSGRRLGYGELVARAATLPVPQDPPLKRSSEFRLLGRRLPRVDTRDKVTGRAVFGIDVRVPGMVFAAVARSPVFGGRLKRYDPQAALQVPGVRKVLEISTGVAVVAENTWAAFQGKRALIYEWEEGPVARWDSTKISQAFAQAAQGAGEVVRSEGDPEGAIAGAGTRVEAVYEVPYLAHACMEPMNCTAHVREDRCEIWAPTQSPQGAQREAARLTGLPLEAITVHVTYLGGGFGRRGSSDYVAEAVELSRLLRRPVQLVWTREDDIQNAMYRPATYNLLRGGLDARGYPVAWSHRLVAPGGAEYLITRGADAIVYRIPNFRLERIVEDPGIPVTAWRAVAPSQNGFVVESFVDELAHAAGEDPYRFRRKLLPQGSRLIGVLDRAAQKASWGSPLPKGKGRGIALWQFGETYVAQVAEVEVDPAGAVRVRRVVCALDCGSIVNPDTIEAQTEGNIAYGLSAALYGAITIDRGRVVESNFHDYRILRLSEMPQVEVHLIPSDHPPGGVGEAALPPIAPAVTNAIFAAAGNRIRRLPIG